MSEFYTSPKIRTPNLWDRLNTPLSKNCGCLLLIITSIVGMGTYLFTRKIRPHETIRHKEAMILGIEIAQGVEHFYDEYNKLPLESSHAPPINHQDTDTDSSSTHPFITILMGMGAEGTTLQNPRNIDFLEGIRPAKNATYGQIPPNWINGLYANNISGPYGVADPWGKQFKLRLDTNNDQQLATPNTDQVKEGRPVILKRVLVWSAGKDGNWDTWDDNPMSWD
jgi:hypothetical protein